jgi:hypothetical protein
MPEYSEQQRSLSRKRHDGAIEFLRELRNPPWLLTAIPADGGSTVTAACHNSKEVRAFIGRYDGRRNLYYTLNPTFEPMDRKPKKSDIASVEYLGPDLDPRKDETPAAAKARYKRALKDRKLNPTFLIDTGNGLQPIFRLKEPIPPQRFAEVEQRSRELCLSLGGTAGTQNVDRLLRLPGTTNIPNAVKRNAGREECYSEVLWWDDHDKPFVYDLEDFPLPEAKAPPTTGREVTIVSPTIDIDGLIRNGLPEGQRSDKGIFRVVCHFAAQGWLPKQIVAELKRRHSPLIDRYKSDAEFVADIERCHSTWQKENPDKVKLVELAKLDPFSYEKRRTQAAKDLAMPRVTALDAIVEQIRKFMKSGDIGVDPPPEEEPWPNSVDGHVLINMLCDLFELFMVLPKYAAEAIALWTIHTHAHDIAAYSPILWISSATGVCGKTTLLEVLSFVVAKPMDAANLSPAVFFRACDHWHPTFLIDELDTFIDANTELRGVLNSGHKKATAHVLRCVGDEQAPTRFSTWSHVALEYADILRRVLQ